MPLLGGRVIFKVYDYNTVGFDELIGCMHIELRDILPDRNGKPGRLKDAYDWKQIYGAPRGVSGDVTKAMNNNPEIASLWKGRILMQTTCELTKKPKLLKKKLPEE